MDENVANNVTDVLENVVKNGTGKKVADIGFPVAGKTGTTDKNKSAWFVGYTRELSTAVTLFRTDPDKGKLLSMNGTGGVPSIHGGDIPAEVWKDYMSEAMKSYGTPEPFPEAEPLGEIVNDTPSPTATPTPTETVEETPSETPTPSDTPSLTPTPTSTCRPFDFRCEDDGGGQNGGPDGGVTSSPTATETETDDSGGGNNGGNNGAGGIFGRPED